MMQQLRLDCIKWVAVGRWGGRAANGREREQAKILISAQKKLEKQNCQMVDAEEKSWKNACQEVNIEGSSKQGFSGKG